MKNVPLMHLTPPCSCQICRNWTHLSRVQLRDLTSYFFSASDDCAKLEYYLSQTKKWNKSLLSIAVACSFAQFIGRNKTRFLFALQLYVSIDRIYVLSVYTNLLMLLFDALLLVELSLGIKMDLLHVVNKYRNWIMSQWLLQMQ